MGLDMKRKSKRLTKVERDKDQILEPDDTIESEKICPQIDCEVIDDYMFENEEDTKDQSDIEIKNPSVTDTLKIQSRSVSMYVSNSQ